MKQFSIHSLWFKCFIFVFTLITLPILAISYASQKYTTQTMLEQKQQSDLKDMEALSLILDTYLDSVESLGLQLADDDTVREKLCAPRPVSDYDPFFKEYLKNNPFICHISLMDPSGVFPYETELDRNRLSWFFNKTLLSELKSTAGCFTKSFSIAYTGIKKILRVVSFLQPCYRQGELLGYVVLFMDTSNFKESLGPFSDTTFILEDNRVFASKQNIPFYSKLFQYYNINYGYLPEDKSIILHSGDTPYVTTTKSYPRLALHFVTMTSYYSLKESVAIGYPGFLSLAVYGTIFALVSAWLIARLITRPIYQLKTVMNHVKSGNFDIRYGNKGKGEVAELGRTFNSLLDTIQNLIATLKANHREQEKIQLQLIQEQIKPHFLYNMLETINSMIRSGMKNEGIQVVNNLATFYRISLNNGSGIIRISQEIQLTKSYLSLQQNRYVEFMDYVLAISPGIYHYTIPKLTLQPIVENAIYHGLKEKCEKGMLCVTGYLENNRIIFEIYDTGVGIAEDKIGEIMAAVDGGGGIDNHFGIASVIKRLNYHCNNQAELKISSELNHYACVTVSFPAAVEMQELPAKEEGL